MELSLWGGAMLGGLISFISPCVLPIVPPTLAYIGGVSLNTLRVGDAEGRQRGHVFVTTLAFVLGFSFIFVLLGVAAPGFAALLNAPLVRYVAGGIIIAMGLHFLGALRIAFLYREARIDVRRKPSGLVGAFVIGMAFGFGWTPCVGPVLTVIFALAAKQESLWQSVAMFGAYSFGLGVPFLLAALFFEAFMGFSARFRKYLGMVEKLMGVMLVGAGLLIMFNGMTWISGWLQETFPSLIEFA